MNVIKRYIKKLKDNKEPGKDGHTEETYIKYIKVLCAKTTKKS